MARVTVYKDIEIDLIEEVLDCHPNQQREIYNELAKSLGSPDSRSGPVGGQCYYFTDFDALKLREAVFVGDSHAVLDIVKHLAVVTPASPSQSFDPDTLEKQAELLRAQKRVN